MAYLPGPSVVITSPAVAQLLDQGITALIKQWRSDGQHNPPALPFALRVQADLHALATCETAKPSLETVSRHESSLSLPQKDRPGYLSTYDAAKRLGMTTQGVTKACRTGRLTFIRAGKAYAIDARSVEEMRRTR